MAFRDTIDWETQGGLPISRQTLTALAFLPVLTVFGPMFLENVLFDGPLVAAPPDQVVLWVFVILFTRFIGLLLSLVLTWVLWIDAGRISELTAEQSADGWTPTRGYAIAGVLHGLGVGFIAPFVLSVPVLLYYLYWRRTYQLGMATGQPKSPLNA